MLQGAVNLPYIEDREDDIMRRNEREMNDKDKIEAFIAKEKIIRIAFYDEYRFYFHGAKEG